MVHKIVATAFSSFFDTIHREKKHSLSYKKARLNQHWCIGILVAILDTVLIELTTSLGTKISLLTSPFWFRWFRSVTIFFNCQSIACFCPKFGLIFCFHLGLKFVGWYDIFLWWLLPLWLPIVPHKKYWLSYILHRRKCYLLTYLQLHGQKHSSLFSSPLL